MGLPTNQELKWERMKRNLEARKNRILDPDPRISDITIKKEDIDAQKMVYQQRADAMRQEALSLQNYLQRLDRHHYIETYQAQQLKKKTLREIEQFRLHEQATETRNVVGKHASSQPYHHDDPQLQGPSAMVNFEGFRLMDPQIPLAKKELQRSMLDEQVHQNAKQLEKVTELDEVLKQAELNVGNTANEYQKRLTDLRHKEEMNTCHTNIQQALDEQRARQAERDTNAKRDQEEIHYWTHGRLLNEVSNKYDRFRRTDWRGISKPQMNEIYDEVHRQQEFKRLQVSKEKQEEMGRVRSIAEHERYTKFKDREALKYKHFADRMLNEENIARGKEDRLRNEVLQKQVYGFNQPNEQFWNQFGRSGR